MPSRHVFLTARLLLETVSLLAVLGWLALLLSAQFAVSPWAVAAYLPVLLGQAFALQRVYIVGHEAAHKKLAPNRLLNDALGQIVLLPILVPVAIYRKVHYFHHGFNRKDHHHSALDVFVSPWPLTPLVRGFYFLLWYLGVFAGGYFLHSVASIVIFLFIPTAKARTISPAFHNWTARDRATAWAQFLACVAFHALVYGLLGPRAWLYGLGLPFLAFAWLWSLLVYIFHYATTIGADVRYNVRRLERHWFFSWLLLNFNEHATHHMKPTIPWYELPAGREELPAPFAAKNQNTGSFLRAILQQWRGPTVVYAKDSNPTPHLFVRWED